MSIKHALYFAAAAIVATPQVAMAEASVPSVSVSRDGSGDLKIINNGDGQSVTVTGGGFSNTIDVKISKKPLKTNSKFLMGSCVVVNTQPASAELSQRGTITGMTVYGSKDNPGPTSYNVQPNFPGKIIYSVAEERLSPCD